MNRKGGLYSIQLLMNGEDIGMLERNARDGRCGGNGLSVFLLEMKNSGFERFHSEIFQLKWLESRFEIY